MILLHSYSSSTARTIMLPLLLLLLSSSLFFLPLAPLPPVLGQQISTTPFTDDVGFRVELPDLPVIGWIAYDIDNRNNITETAVENELGYTKLVVFCAEVSAMPYRGPASSPGDLECNEEPKGDNEYVQVFRYRDLDKRPEFASIVQSGRQITSNDLFVYNLAEIQRKSNSVNPPQILENKTAVDSVDLIDTANGGMQIDGQLVVFRYEKLPPIHPSDDDGWRTAYNLYFVDPITGYGYRMVSESGSVNQFYDENSLTHNPLSERMLAIFNSTGIDHTPPPLAPQHEVRRYTPPPPNW